MLANRASTLMSNEDVHAQGKCIGVCDDGMRRKRHRECADKKGGGLVALAPAQVA